MSLYNCVTMIRSLTRVRFLTSSTRGPCRRKQATRPVSGRNQPPGSTGEICSVSSDMESAPSKDPSARTICRACFSMNVRYASWPLAHSRPQSDGRSAPDCRRRPAYQRPPPQIQCFTMLTSASGRTAKSPCSSKGARARMARALSFSAAAGHTT